MCVNYSRDMYMLNDSEFSVNFFKLLTFFILNHSRVYSIFLYDSISINSSTFPIFYHSTAHFILIILSSFRLLQFIPQPLSNFVIFSPNTVIIPRFFQIVVVYKLQLVPYIMAILPRKI